MQEYLIDKAIDQIWCNPKQDNQSVFRPAKVTKGVGALNSVFILDRNLTLPWANTRAHVFQVAQIPPTLIGLFEDIPSWTKEKWYTFEEAMNKLPLYVNIYNEFGVNIPRFNACFMFTRERCLVFAVKVDRRIPVDYGADNIYFRFYTSAYLQNYHAEPNTPGIEIKGYEAIKRDQFNIVVADYNRSKTRVGHTEAFVNGQMVSELSIRTLKEGDLIEWIYEATVKRIVTWKIDDLKPFTSLLDRKGKYILHYPKEIPVDTIDYADDIDIYIQTQGKYQTKIGRFYIPNNPGAKRNLTHRDYSIVGDYVRYIALGLAEYLGLVIPNILNFEVVMKIREGGYIRPLVQDSSRIHDLYELSDQNIMMAMTGALTQVPVWTAAQLEQSAYVRLMGTDYFDITIDKVENAYGYNSIAKILADSPIKMSMHGNQPYAVIGYEAALGSLVYEYDQNGVLLGTHQHNSPDDSYEAYDRRTRMIETVIGEASMGPDVTYGFNNIPVPEEWSWRLYRCHMNYNVDPPEPFRDWEDVTDTDLYTVENGVIVWGTQETDQYLCLKTDKNIITYDLELKENVGNILFELFEYINENGTMERRQMELPPGNLHIFVNGYRLVYGIDYVVNFPYVCINNQKFFNQPASEMTQWIHVRMTGFCDKDLKIIPPSETGFVRNGTISNDKAYHSHHNKIMNIIIGGSTMHTDDVNFYEDNPEWQPRARINGRPYQIDNVITPLKTFTERDTYDLLKQDTVIEDSIEAYMSLYWEPRPDEPLSSSEVRWRLVSPFFACLVALCSQGYWYFPDDEILTDAQVEDLCRPYFNLLDYDPISTGIDLPDLYTNVTPHRNALPVQVTRAQYRVLQTAVRLFGRGKIGLNNFITFTI